MDMVRGDVDNPAQYDVVKGLLDLRSGDTVLDVGCGTGAAVRVFGQIVGGSGKVIGIDNSKTMIAEAKKRSRLKQLPISFRIADAHHLPFSDNYFDRVFALRVFEIIEDPVQALREMLRVTKPGGRIFVNGPDVDGWTFDVPDRDLTRSILHHICDHEVNGWIGRQLPRLFMQFGGSNVITLSDSSFLHDFELMNDLYLKQLLDNAQASNVISVAAAEAWFGQLRERCELGPYAHSQRIFRVVASKT